MRNAALLALFAVGCAPVEVTPVNLYGLWARDEGFQFVFSFSPTTEDPDLEGEEDVYNFYVYVETPEGPDGLAEATWEKGTFTTSSEAIGLTPLFSQEGGASVPYELVVDRLTDRALVTDAGKNTFRWERARLLP